MGTARHTLAGRRPAAGAALFGILLVVPSVASPTWEMAVADREHGSLLSRQWEWSWGRVRLTGLEGVELSDQWNPIGLTVLLLVLAAAVVGVAAWAVRRSSWSQAVALVAVSLLAGRVLTTVSARIGHSLNEVDRGAAGLTVRTDMTSAGSLESAAAVVLVVALALLVTATVLDPGRTPPVPGATSVPNAAPETDAGPAGARAGVAGLRPAGEHLTTPPVSFDERRAGAADSSDRTPTSGPPGRTGGRS